MDKINLPLELLNNIFSYSSSPTAALIKSRVHEFNEFSNSPLSTALSRILAEDPENINVDVDSLPFHFFHFFMVKVDGVQEDEYPCRNCPDMLISGNDDYCISCQNDIDEMHAQR